MLFRSRRVALSTVTLDDEAIVMRSMQLDEIPRARLATIAGSIPHPLARPAGCPFHPRCPDAIDACRASVPELAAAGDGQIVPIPINLDTINQLYGTQFTSLDFGGTQHLGETDIPAGADQR